jgi:NAD(P)-dependent dehydrogenase (short-subunit alcohol dehydrogenase family)
VSLQPRSIILLGARSDIGSVIAKRVVDTGHRVLLVSRSAREEQDIEASDSVHVADGVDLLTSDGQTRLVEAVERFTTSAWGSKHDVAMVHSVGDFWHHRPLDRLSRELVRQTMLAHYATLAESVVSVLPALTRARTSRIVAFSCNSVLYAYPHMAPFTAAKAAIETFMRCIAHEYAEQQVATSTIALPTVLTQKVQEAKPQGDHAHYVTPDDVASVVLREVEASPLVTGNVTRMIRHSATFYGMGYLERNPPDEH